MAGKKQKTKFTPPFNCILTDLFIWKFRAQANQEKTESDVLMKIHIKGRRRKGLTKEIERGEVDEKGECLTEGDTQMMVS